jgi:hypothetical protein
MRRKVNEKKRILFIGKILPPLPFSASSNVASG